MLAAVTRLITKRCLTTCAALATAASVAALSPNNCTKPILSGQPSHTGAAPGLLASAVETLAGGGAGITPGTHRPTAARRPVSPPPHGAKTTRATARRPAEAGDGGR